MSGFVYAIATMDTKAVELKYVADCLRGAGVQVRMVDVGASEQKRFSPDVTREQVRAGKPEKPSESRAEAIAAMADFLKSYLLNRAADGHVVGVDVHGAVAARERLRREGKRRVELTLHRNSAG